MGICCECSAPRWSEFKDPLTGRTVGQQLMLNQSFKTGMGYKWGGLAVVIVASFVFNGLIWLVLAVLKGPHHSVHAAVSAHRTVAVAAPMKSLAKHGAMSHC